MTKGHSPIADDLAEASWTAADLALAVAWRDLRRVLAVIEDGNPRKGSRLQVVADEAELVREALDRAVRLRGLVRIGIAGAVERFDATRHESLDGGRQRGGVLVSIVTPGLARIVGDREEIVASALVKRVHPPKPRPARAKAAARGASGEGRSRKPVVGIQPQAERRERAGA